MDIIITGEQGAGKSTAAAKLLKALNKDALEVTEISDDPGHIVALLTEHRARAVLFDECITKPSQLLTAVSALKTYRERINADVLAIYVTHGSAVVLTDGPTRKNMFKTDGVKPSGRMAYETAEQFKERTAALGATSNNGTDWVPTGRTDRILTSLWETLAEKVDEQGAGDMYHELCRIVGDLPDGQEPALHHLTKEGKMELHTFLLKLLRRYE